MSQENMEVVRGIFYSWSKGDFRGGVNDLDPHVVFIVRPPLAEPAVRVGPEGIRDYMGEFLRQWTNFVIEAKELTPDGRHGRGLRGVAGDWPWERHSHGSLALHALHFSWPKDQRAAGKQVPVTRSKPSKPSGCGSTPVAFTRSRVRHDARYARDTERAMSQENVEVVKVAYEAFARGGLDRYLSSSPTMSTTGRSRARSTTAVRSMARAPCGHTSRTGSTRSTGSASSWWS